MSVQPPETPLTLIGRLAEEGAAEALWERFVQLYRPVIRAWLALNGLPEAARDEGVQDVLLRLVRVFRGRGFDPTRARFRTFLGRVVRSVAYDRLRADRRDVGHRCLLAEEAQRTEGVDGCTPELQLEAQFRWAVYEAAVRMLKESGRLSELQRQVLDACVLDEVSPSALARTLGVKANRVIQTKKRLLERIRAYAAGFGD